MLQVHIGNPFLSWRAALALGAALPALLIGLAAPLHAQVLTDADPDGADAQGIADTQFSLAANYVFRIGSKDAFVRADWQHIGDLAFFDDPAQQAIFDAAGYTREQNLINASLGIRMRSGFAVSLWARNLLNDEYLIFASPTVLQAGSFSGAPGQPRTFGVTLRRTF